ncbi:hypothetical protein WDU94_014703 [Cyamophila willieti]
MSLSFFFNTPKAPNSPLTGAINDFTKEVYFDLAANFQRNAIISPLSLHMALGLTLFGSKDETSYAIMKGLQIKNPDTLLNDYKNIIEQLTKSPELKVANKIYFRQEVQLDPNYETGALQYFNSALGKVDFNQSQSAADQINMWVAKQTNNTINNLIGPSNITSDTMLLLINAIYFKGTWVNTFKRNNTKNKPFYLTETHSIRVPMMYIKEEFIMQVEAGDEGFAMLELPYGTKQEQRFSMHIFLPNKRSGLAVLEKKFFQTNESFADKFGNIVNNGFKTKVEVTLPRFKITSFWNMTNLCKKLGMGVAFTPSADFSQMTLNNSPLCISDVIQKAFIEVNEEGTVASAATAVTMLFAGPRVPEKPITFIADHPFFVTISTTNTRDILFVAKVAGSDAFEIK